MTSHWLKHNWSKWSAPIQQGMKVFPSSYTWSINPPVNENKPDFFRWIQERNCLTCNKIQRRQIKASISD